MGSARLLGLLYPSYTALLSTIATRSTDSCAMGGWLLWNVPPIRKHDPDEPLQAGGRRHVT